MNGLSRTRRTNALVLGAVVALLVAPGMAAGHDPAPPAAAAQRASTDLAPVLGADGTFQGAAGVAGTVDASAWTLVSDLAAGEPPRFAPAASAAGVISLADTGSWSALGSNGSGNGALNAWVVAIAVSGSDLYVGGDFTNAAGIPAADYVARWNGSIWSALGSSSGNGALNNSVRALAVSGSDLYVGGGFDDAAGIPTADNIAKWSGSAWSAVGSNGSGNGAINNWVQVLTVSGSDLHVGGYFTNAAGIPEADRVATWNGTAWAALGSNGVGIGALNGPVLALAVSGSDLYVGGNFANAAGIPEADIIARWNGSAWSALGSNGVGIGALNYQVSALAVSGTDLYVGGAFYNAAGIAAADYIARWNGSVWSALGSNGSGDGALSGPVWALAVSGSDLYVGGGFSYAAGTASNVAKWNGSAWSALGSSAGNWVLNSTVLALAVSGDDVHVGGWFTDAAGMATADYVAKWTRSASASVPGAPTGVSAVAGNAAATVTWTAPASTGGSPITGYTATSAPDSKTCATSGALSCTVTGLTNGQAYTFTVTAANVAGTGPDSAASTPVTPHAAAVVRQPDGRIRLGTSGAFIGDNVYNTSGASQSKTGSARKGKTVTFGISIQNDGTAADSFKVKATGSASSKYTVKYYAGTKDITAKVVAGTYRTASLAVGVAVLITAKVTIKTSAAKGSKVTRLVTITSAGDSSKKDAVKFVARRS
jgi:hypothetical protein